MNRNQKMLKINTLKYQFNFIDAVQIQDLLIALNNGYELKKIESCRGVVEFVLEEVK